jgi:hypothetical protein
MRSRLTCLLAAEKRFVTTLTALSASSPAATSSISLTVCDVSPAHVGPNSAVDAALAMAWLDTFGNHSLEQFSLSTSSTASISGVFSNQQLTMGTLQKHLRGLRGEIVFLQQMSLAAKVVAHVTSPQHKKLLNLCHNWLRFVFVH